MRLKQPNHARLVPMRDGTVQFFSSFNRGLVDELKAQIPSVERKWDSAEKCWRVTTAAAQICADLTLTFLGLEIEVPQQAQVAAHRPASTQLLRLEYLGKAKDRGDGSPTAMGWVDGGWNAIFPLRVLRNWFEMGDGEAKPTEVVTLYAVLGIGRKAPQAEIKKAYRRAARQWHPDVNEEEDAAEQFRRIQHAWEVLGNQRAKYDAALTLEASLEPAWKHGKLYNQFRGQWVPPLRCGYVLAEVKEQLGRFVVSRILQWEDILDPFQRVMVSYWPKGGDQFKVKWVET